MKWTHVFADELVAIADERPDVVGITAAMAEPTGIAKLARKYPERVYDVGIAEQHAATSAAGLAIGGLHPVVAVYATFLNRAFDQVLLDVAMHKLPVTFVLDRAGITGPDGPSHYGIWDMSVFGVVPGPADRRAPRRRHAARGAARGGRRRRRPDHRALPDRLGRRRPAGRCAGSARSTCCAESARTDVLLVAVGSFGQLGVEVAARVAEQGYGVTVVDPRWVRPVPAELVELAAEHRLVVTVEDGVRTGGVGDALAQAMRDADVGCRCATWACRPAGTRTAPAAQILADLGPDRAGRGPRRHRLDLRPRRAARLAPVRLPTGQRRRPAAQPARAELSRGDESAETGGWPAASARPTRPAVRSVAVGRTVVGLGQRPPTEPVVGLVLGRPG